MTKFMPRKPVGNTSQYNVGYLARQSGKYQERHRNYTENNLIDAYETRNNDSGLIRALSEKGIKASPEQISFAKECVGAGMTTREQVTNFAGKRKAAFTLVELLIVIGIISILVSILMPSIVKAREEARRAVCGTNLKNIGTSMHMYANEHQDTIPIDNLGSKSA